MISTVKDLANQAFVGKRWIPLAEHRFHEMAIGGYPDIMNEGCSKQSAALRVGQIGISKELLS
jgi:hypothetical protein